MSNEVAVGLMSGIVTLALAIIAYLTRDIRKAKAPPSAVDDYEKLVNRLTERLEKQDDRITTLETERDTNQSEREQERAEARHLRERVRELEASEKALKAEVARLRGLVERPGTGPLGKEA